MESGDTMSLFGNSDKDSFFGKKTEEEKHEFMLKGLASLVGAGAGAGAGALASIPLDARYRKDLATSAVKDSQDKQVAKQNWKILLRLTRGQMRLEDLPENQRAFFEKELQDNRKILQSMKNNPQIAKNSLDELDKGIVRPLFPGAESGTPHRNLEFLIQQSGDLPEGKGTVLPLFPGADNARPLGKPNYKVSHPASGKVKGLLGLAGSIAGDIAMKQYLSSKKEGE